jgi:hypothetical protein
LSTGYSQPCRVLPKKRVADEESEDSNGKNLQRKIII